MKREPGILKTLIHNPALSIAVIFIIGLVLSPSGADVAALKRGTVDIASSGKLSRIITVGLAGLLTLGVFMSNPANRIKAMFTGNLRYLTIYACLALLTVVFSQLKGMTMFKGIEVLLICMVGAIIATSKDRESSAITFTTGVFWIYTLSVFSALIELAVFGSAQHKQLVGATPLLSTQMESSYPPMVGNGLGFLGALTALFGLYRFDMPQARNRTKAIALIILAAGAVILFLSYTRSVLLFFIVSVLIIAAYEKRTIRIGVILITVISLLAAPGIQDKVIDHLRRGATDEQITSLSSRTQFWDTILKRDPVQLMVGEGFATGTLFQDYQSRGTHKVFTSRNAHNSVLEIIMSSGFIGAAIWLTIIIRIGLQMVKIRRKLRSMKEWGRLHFHHFMMGVFVLSVLRSIMNSTFVYVDYFFFVFLAMIMYTETLSISLLRPKTIAPKFRPMSR
jgi:O-antigen ligase